MHCYPTPGQLRGTMAMSVEGGNAPLADAIHMALMRQQIAAAAPSYPVSYHTVRGIDPSVNHLTRDPNEAA
jgi:hypothetical protein